MRLKLSLQYLEILMFQPLSSESSSVTDVYICYSAPKKHWSVVVIQMGNARIANKNLYNSGCSGGYQSWVSH